MFIIKIQTNENGISILNFKLIINNILGFLKTS